MNRLTPIQQTIQQLIFGKDGGETSSTSDGPLQFRPVGGGSINTAYQVLTQKNKKWFCKLNDATRFPGLFEKERNGLLLLQQQNIFRIPGIIACETVGDQQILILEWIDQETQTGHGTGFPAQPGNPSSDRDGFWHLFGKELAQLHLLPQDHFGLGEDNYMGALPQDNTPSDNWTEFFVQRRLEPQVRLAVEKGLLPTAAIRQFWSLYLSLPEIFPDESPSLLHGDLWSGNFLRDDWGQPVLIDPAVYYGHRGMDLAMTTLFGGFDPKFYEAYAYYHPLPANHQEQWEVCNLYPLLVHLNLFGKGLRQGVGPSPSSPVTFASLSYLADILNTIQRF